jgi:hypothetical protein
LESQGRSVFPSTLFVSLARNCISFTSLALKAGYLEDDGKIADLHPQHNTYKAICIKYKNNDYVSDRCDAKVNENPKLDGEPGDEVG